MKTKEILGILMLTMVNPVMTHAIQAQEIKPLAVCGNSVSVFRLPNGKGIPSKDIAVLNYGPQSSVPLVAVTVVISWASDGSLVASGPEIYVRAKMDGTGYFIPKGRQDPMGKCSIVMQSPTGFSAGN